MTATNETIIRPATPYAYGAYAKMSSAEKRQVARDRVQKFIDEGRAAAPAAVAKILAEQPVDYIVRSQALHVDGDGAALGLSVPKRDEEGAFAPIGGFSDHALDQVADRLRFHGRYLSELRGTDWGRQLIATNLNELARHRPDGERLLVRAVEGKVRGVLSNGYRPDDSRPAVDALIGVAQEAGALITSATALDHRVSVKAIIAEPVEVFEGEWAVFGLDFRTGDYGGVAREIMGWILRCACLNGAVVSANYRKVHIGGRITDEVDYSNRTRKLNDALTTSQTKDIARSLLGREAVAKQVARLRAANETTLDPDAALASLKKSVNKAEEKAIVDKYNSPDIELLPPGPTTWRWSNAISWLAGETKDAERRLDLERLAGEVIESAAPAAA